MLENIMDPYFVSGVVLNVLLYYAVYFSLKPYNMSVLFLIYGRNYKICSRDTISIW